jgi:hypothetical protein
VAFTAAIPAPVMPNTNAVVATIIEADGLGTCM